MLIANCLSYPLQLSLHRAVIDCATDPYDGTPENGLIKRVARPNFSSSQLFHLDFQRLPVSLTEITGAADLRFGESHTPIQFLLKLFHDWFQKAYTPMIDQYGDEISHGLRDSIARNNCIQHRSLLLRGDRRRFPNRPQFLTL